MLTVNRKNEPPLAGPEVWVRRLGGQEKIKCVICSHSFWGFMVHWAGNHSEPCFAETKACPGHRRGLPLKWKGYLYVADQIAREHQFLELPPQAAKDLLNWFHPVTDLRGQIVLVTRGAGKKARLKIEPQGIWDEETWGPLAKDKDPIITLCKLWGLDPTQVNLNGQNDVPTFKIA